MIRVGIDPISFLVQNMNILFAHLHHTRTLRTSISSRKGFHSSMGFLSALAAAIIAPISLILVAISSPLMIFFFMRMVLIPVLCLPMMWMIDTGVGDRIPVREDGVGTCEILRDVLLFFVRGVAVFLGPHIYFIMEKGVHSLCIYYSTPWRETLHFSTNQKSCTDRYRRPIVQSTTTTSL